jgi:chemotaxis protein CheZ
MAIPRKVFRIEEMGAPRPEPPTSGQKPRDADIAQELSALRSLLAQAPPRQVGETSGPRQGDVDRLSSELRFIRFALGGGEQDPLAQTLRITNELQAVMQGSEQATQKILAAAEDIDQAANNLSAALKGDIERGLAQDMRDRVINIFEACNFQDLTSQRVAKVMAALDGLERQIVRVLDELARADGTPPMHGPRLPSDDGHLSQDDIDSLFGTGSA